MGSGVQSGWSDPSDPNWVPSGSDFQKLFADVKRLAVRPAGRWLRFDTSLVADNNWYNCRVASAQYDVDAELGKILPVISGTADTFNITTTGIWGCGVRERYSGSSSGDHSLRITSGSTVLAEKSNVINPLHVSTNWCYTEAYLTAGSTVVFQHKYQLFGTDTSPLVLYTTNPTPEIIMRLVQERDLHA